MWSSPRNLAILMGLLPAPLGAVGEALSSKRTLMWSNLLCLMAWHSKVSFISCVGICASRARPKRVGRKAPLKTSAFSCVMYWNSSSSTAFEELFPPPFFFPLPPLGAGRDAPFFLLADATAGALKSDLTKDRAFMGFPDATALLPFFDPLAAGAFLAPFFFGLAPITAFWSVMVSL